MGSPGKQYTQVLCVCVCVCGGVAHKMKWLVWTVIETCKGSDSFRMKTIDHLRHIGLEVGGASAARGSGGIGSLSDNVAAF